ncbi:MAG: glucose-6-phosphate 1-dehydrogenase [Acidobacteriales bacterium]|nr:glucose-6-phosphate 1-dehydrogenase [Terriglobales bacterium]
MSATTVEPKPITATANHKVPRSPLPKAESCVLVIFGATGDLTKRKLIPAIYDLSCEGCMDDKFRILGVGRSAMSDDEFRASMRDAMTQAKGKPINDDEWKKFAGRLSYMGGDPADANTFPNLAKKLEEMSKQGASNNHLFYLSVPPSVSPEIVEGLGRVGLAKNDKGWSRIIVEKPFGRDLNSARELNAVVAKVFDESQVYRIDHYLGKETVQNILVFRFGNSLFEPVWNRNYVDFVEITAAETLGVESRASFYEETGALRDMVANHLLQLLTLTAMEPPVAFDANSVREEKVKLLRAIRPLNNVKDVAAHTVRGQYGPGTINGKPVPGYREEKGVAKDSRTETYAAVEFHIDNWRWSGVPFYVRAGKRLAKPLTEIRVHLKPTPQALFSRNRNEHIEPNIITIRIQPNEGIGINFAAKRPGTEMHTTTVHMNFSYEEAFATKSPQAYATLLLDAMRGDATLFTRGDEVEAEWRLITPIEEAWAQLSLPQSMIYPAGSNGPTGADGLITGRDHHWRDLQEQYAPGGQVR